MPSDAATAPTSLQGACFCGSASYTVTGKPVLSAYCHCTNCQRLNGCPFVHTAHFEAENFSWNFSEPPDERLDRFAIPSRPHKTRVRCKNCGAGVASYNSTTNRWSVWGALLRRGSDGAIEGWDIVRPTAHIFYGTRMLDIGDSLGKWEGYENRSVQLA
ncbi:hypothetical protein BDW22DRAFT_1406914 [Trametopsis cervina]|nr:hypothetical protein BDW22DRAFT_1406914 [Trametopsis cervina]